MAGTDPKASEKRHANPGENPVPKQKRTIKTDMRAPTPCIANTADMRRPLLEAEDDSDVTVAARGYSPPTPAPRKNLQQAICP